MSNDLIFSTRNIPSFGLYSALNIFFQSVPKHDRAVTFGTIYECIRIQSSLFPTFETPLKALDASHFNGKINLPAAASAVVRHGLYFFELTF
jgi:hypothetical protein